jgi:hypothetical protein
LEWVARGFQAGGEIYQPFRRMRCDHIDSLAAIATKKLDRFQKAPPT